MGAFQLKITIKDSHPPIWRRVLVPVEISFESLHKIIQEVFGWTDSHLAAFEVDGFWLNCRTPGSSWNSDEDDDYDDFDGSTEDALDEWIAEGDTFRYVYDFGDDWMHIIKVEKFVECDQRYPVVLKSKGPNMLEDCGGLWGFEELREQAPDFDMAAVNREMAGWELPFVSPTEEDILAMWQDMGLEEDELLVAAEDLFSEEDGFFETSDDLFGDTGFLPDEETIIKRMRDSLGDIESLEDVYRQYTKEILKTIAQIMYINGSSYYKKAELIPWLRSRMLEENHLRRVILEMHPKEKALMERVMELGGGLLSEALVSESAVLSSYGAYTMMDDEIGFYQIPLDVQQAWRRVMTEEFQKEWKYKTEFRAYCEGAVFLYGVLPVEKMLEIYNHFEEEQQSESEFFLELMDLSMRKDSIYCTGDFVMAPGLAEDDAYHRLLERQGTREYYIPSSKQEMMSYGHYGFQPMDDSTEWFMNFMEEELGMDAVDAFAMFSFIQIALRESEDIQLGVQLLKEAGCCMNSKKLKRAKDMLLKLSRQIRRPELRGFTMAEAYRPIKR